MSNVSTEQFEYFLSLMGALVDGQKAQVEALEKLALSLDTIDGTLDDLRYHIRYGGDT